MPGMYALLETIHAEEVFRLVLASALGGLIGLERVHHGRSAGLRTQLLVSLGACLAMLVSVQFGVVYGDRGGDSSIRVDPARMAYGVMTGIGFLGAGTIIQYGVGVRGLTTAASLWCAAAVGLAVGFGMYLVGLAGTALVLAALVLLNWVERRVVSNQTRTVTLTLPDVSAEAVDRFRQLLSESGARVVNVNTAQDFKAGQSVLTYTLTCSADQLSRAVAAIRQHAGEISTLKVE
jgi:putative Mg2+ transporter-C (MgtC) family protein